MKKLFHFLLFISILRGEFKDCEGGWKCFVDLKTATRKGETDFCDFDIRDGSTMTSLEFEKQYRFRKPVLLQFDEPWIDLQLFTKEHLVELTKNEPLSVASSLHIVRTGGQGMFKASVADFTENYMHSQKVQNEPFYIFTRMLFANNREWIKKPQAFAKDDFADLDDIFMLGTTNSGTSFHRHADAWTAVFFGAKRWFLYPPAYTPAGGVWPGFSMIDWLKKVYNKLWKQPKNLSKKRKDREYRKPMECLQRPNTILYIPEGWYHGVLNVNDTVALSFQQREASIFPITFYYQKRKRMSPEQKIHNLKKILKKHPKNAQAWHDYGWSYNEMGEIKKAVKYLKKSIEVEPKFINSYTALVQICMQNEAVKPCSLLQAWKYIERAYKLNSNNLDTARHRAFVAERMFRLNIAEDMTYFPIAIEMWTQVMLEHPREKVREYAEGQLTRLDNLAETLDSNLEKTIEEMENFNPQQRMQAPGPRVRKTEL